MKLELEETTELLKKVAKEYKTYGDLDNPEFEDKMKIAEAIETVLKELENKDKQIQKLQAVNKMQDYRINEMDIPRKKIKDKIKKLEKKKRDLSPFGMGKIEGLYELLEEK